MRLSYRISASVVKSKVFQQSCCRQWPDRGESFPTDALQATAVHPPTAPASGRAGSSLTEQEEVWYDSTEELEEDEYSQEQRDEMEKIYSSTMTDIKEGDLPDIDAATAESVKKD